jgi:hypothetical protein
MPHAFSEEAVSDGNSGIGNRIKPGGIRVSVKFGSEKINFMSGIGKIAHEGEYIRTDAGTPMLTTEGINTDFQETTSETAEKYRLL